MSTTAAFVDKELVSEEWYHGLLPREDIDRLLLKNGDFLVRTTEPKPNKTPSLVLSMMYNDTRKEGGIKHYIVSNKDGGFFIEKSAFPSVSALVNHHIKTEESLTNFKGSCPAVIRRPIPTQDWEISHEDVTLKKLLGEGCSEEVFRGSLRHNGKTVDVAVKVAKLEYLSRDQVQEVMSEARVLRRLDHPNVCKFYGVAACNEPLMVVMELANEGPLHAYIKNNTLPIDKLNEMVLQAAWGIEYIHANNVIHRDIALRNCLYSDGKVKIADFSMAKQGTSYHNESTDRVPIRWLSPETLTTATFTQHTDVWAFGVMAWEIYHDGREPYTGMSVCEVARQVVENGYKMHFREWVPQSLAHFITNRVWIHVNQRAFMDNVVRKLQAMFAIDRPDFSAEENIRK